MSNSEINKKISELEVEWEKIDTARSEYLDRMIENTKNGVAGIFKIYIKKMKEKSKNHL